MTENERLYYTFAIERLEAGKKIAEERLDEVTKVARMLSNAKSRIEEALIAERVEMGILKDRVKRLESFANEAENLLPGVKKLLLGEYMNV